nr:hypothetical protein [Tanacetum cinerariifolium]
MQTQTSNTLHNAIMEAGSKDRPSMLAPGNYIQWKSRIKKYIDTKPNQELIHYCLKNPPYKLGWKEKDVIDSEGNPTTSTERVWIDNDIYSTVDACPNACEMWKAIERLKQDAVDTGPIFDKEPEQKQSGSVHKTYLIKQDVHNVIIESEDMNYDSEQIDQNDEDTDLAEERELLASLIEKLKCEIDETKNRNTLLETSNKVLVEKLKSELEDFRNKNKSLTEANNKLSKENDLLFADFMKSKVELKRRDSIEYASEMELECEKVK